jgi:hypothetical protein
MHRLERRERHDPTFGRSARTVNRPGAFGGEMFATAVASFGGRVGAFRTKRRCRRSQIR